MPITSNKDRQRAGDNQKQNSRTSSLPSNGSSTAFPGSDKNTTDLRILPQLVTVQRTVNRQTPGTRYVRMFLEPPRHRGIYPRAGWCYVNSLDQP